MKKKHLISTLIACMLLTGCAANGSTPANSRKINYSDMFQPRTSDGGNLREDEVNGIAESPVVENGAVSDDKGAADEGSAGNVSLDDERTISNSRFANAAAGTAEQSVNETSNADSQKEDNAGSDAQSNEAEQSSAGATPRAAADADETVTTIDNRNPKSIVYTDAQAVADLLLGDICYFPYKTGDEDIPEDENGSEVDGDNENESEESPKEEIRVPKKKYDYGYRVVFRTESDTYLLGIFPYDYCKFEDVNDMCLKISDLIEADCEMVGIPSFDDLRYFTDCGIYLPGKYEMWTQTPATPDGKKMYYRNEKGAFYSTKSKTLSCGVCAIIRVSASQNDPELLSSSLPNYEEAKARLEAEEEQYKQSISEE